MKFKIIATALFLSFFLNGNAQILKDAMNKGKDVMKGNNSGPLTNEEVVRGLKEALSTGAKKSSEAAARVDGFNKNPKIFIPWPAEAQSMKERLVKMGMEKKVTEFEVSMNRAAEEAAKEAYGIFADAVTGMSVGDGFAILNGGDTAATHYLREKTFAPLKVKFTPIVKAAIDKVQVTAYWNPLVTTYNKLPGVTKQNPDIEDYITNKAINGLMILISEQEAKIRRDPAAQASELLKRVFGGGK